jgi:hypothetical protein
MSKEFIQCPKDPKNLYYREACEEIFRKGHIRFWCKKCTAFKDNPVPVSSGD